MSISDEMSFGYRRKTKITKPEPKLPMIDYQKRVINFGDDLELFKVVSQLIMTRVDLGRVDLGPLGTGQPAIGPGRTIIDLDELPADDDADQAADDSAAEEPSAPISRRFGLYRHPDRYGAT